jgi:hypothetical protein
MALMAAVAQPMRVWVLVGMVVFTVDAGLVLRWWL